MIPYVPDFFNEALRSIGAGEWGAYDGDGNGEGSITLSPYWLFYEHQNKRKAKGEYRTERPAVALSLRRRG